MRFIAALIVCLSVFAFSAPAHAWWTTDVGASSASEAPHSGQRYAYRGRHGVRHYAYGGGGCAHLGRKQCGCIAMQQVGLTDTRFWAVRSWFSFPRTQPHVGAAAIWPGRHVEIVTAVNGDGTVATRGSVGFSRVPIGRLVFVDPHGGQSAWASGEPPQHAAHVVTHHYRHYAHAHHYRHYAQRK